jgi:hypothetical protein
VVGLERYWEEKVLPLSSVAVGGGDGGGRGGNGGGDSGMKGPVVAPLKAIIYCPAAAGTEKLVFVDEEEEGEKKKKKKKESLAVEVKGWGGVMILPHINKSTQTHTHTAAHHCLSEKDYHHITHFLHTLLRRWLGFPSSPYTHTHTHTHIFLHPLELDTLVLHTLHVRRQEAFHHLHTLTHLVEKRPQLHVSARVAHAVHTAIHYLQEGRRRKEKEKEKENETVGTAASSSSSLSLSSSSSSSSSSSTPTTSSSPFSHTHTHSSPSSLLSSTNLAYHHAHTAHQDPSLLTPPFSPFEHYAAIFLPLLLPTLLPLVMGVKNEWGRYKEKRKGV